MKRALLRSLIASGLVLGGLGCRGVESDTGFVVDVSTNLRWPDEMDKVRVRVDGVGGKAAFDRIYDLGQGKDLVQLPGRLALFPEGTGSAHFHVEVSGWSSADELTTKVTRSATVGFVKHLVLVLPMPLERACRMKTCEAGRTCKVIQEEGTCVDDIVDPATLQRYAAPTKVSPPVDVDGGNGPASFDAEVGPLPDSAGADLEVDSAPDSSQPGAMDAAVDSPVDGGADDHSEAADVVQDSAPEALEPPTCGNGRIDPGETCEPGSAKDCPSLCPMMGCTTRRLDPGTDKCHSSCVPSGTFTQCLAATDGCCPDACNARVGDPSFDADCPARCGNGVTEPGENCDADCSTRVTGCLVDADNDPIISGSVAACTYKCTPRGRGCQTGDGYCPSACSNATDGDCKLNAGDSCSTTGQCEAGLSCTDARCCTQSSCGQCGVCTGVGGTCQGLTGDDLRAGATCNSATSTCVSGTCKLKVGQSGCANNPACSSGVCIAGTCCQPGCAAGAGTACAATSCSASGACVFPGSGTTCGAGMCSADATQAMASVCNGGGSCTVQNTSCGPGLKCRAATGACPAACSSDNDCLSAYSCDVAGGSCKLRAGNSCTAGANCASGLCDAVTGTCVSACSPAETAVGGMCKLSDGQTCSSSAVCASGICDSGSGRCTSLAISPTAHDYGSVPMGTTSSSATFTVTNRGGSSTGIFMVALGGANPSEFTIAGNNCTATLPPAGSCTVSVAFKPTAAGTRNATLNLSASPGGGTVATLTGTGASTIFNISPTSQAFGSVAVGSQSPGTTFTVTNVGQTSTGPMIVSVGGANGGDFPMSVAASTCTGSTLAVGATCTVTVAFHPSATGPRNGSLSVSANPGGTNSATLSGTGQ
jgi:hypothetical protein